MLFIPGVLLLVTKSHRKMQRLRDESEVSLIVNLEKSRDLDASVTLSQFQSDSPGNDDRASESGKQGDADKSSFVTVKPPLDHSTIKQQLEESARKAADAKQVEDAAGNDGDEDQNIIYDEGDDDYDYDEYYDTDDIKHLFERTGLGDRKKWLKVFEKMRKWLPKKAMHKPPKKNKQST
jgi:hypothetical protein